jgi:hypothetical protein
MNGVPVATNLWSKGPDLVNRIICSLDPRKMIYVHGVNADHECAKVVGSQVGTVPLLYC